MNTLWQDLLPNLWPAFWATIKLTLFSALGAFVLGVLLTALRVSPVPIARTIASFYINTVRNTPLTLLVLFASIGLYQNLGMTLAPNNDHFIENNNFMLAVLAFTAYTAAFVSESIRSGINTVPFGQAEAARSLGLSFTTILGQIIFPQALRNSIIPLGNTLIALTKNTTIASTIGVAEASLLMKSTIENHADSLFIIFGIFALGFMILTLPLGLILNQANKRLVVQR